MSRNYILTNHALTRVGERKIPESFIRETISNPDRVRVSEKGGEEFMKVIDGKTISAIVKKNELGEKIVLSAWVNPPFPGTKDFKKKERYKQMQKAGVLKKLYLTLLDQLGL